jgi:hypothetical protein
MSEVFQAFGDLVGVASVSNCCQCMTSGPAGVSGAKGERRGLAECRAAIDIIRDCQRCFAEGSGTPHFAVIGGERGFAEQLVEGKDGILDPPGPHFGLCGALQEASGEGLISESTIDHRQPAAACRLAGPAGSTFRQLPGILKDGHGILQQLVVRQKTPELDRGPGGRIVLNGGEKVRAGLAEFVVGFRLHRQTKEPRGEQM